MFVPAPKFELGDDARRAIWLIDKAGRVRPTHAIYHLWYTPPISTASLPVAMTHTDWWPAEQIEYVSAIPNVAHDWISTRWPTLEQDFRELAELCWLWRSRCELLTDALTIFWANHAPAARVLLGARKAPELMPFLSNDDAAFLPEVVRSKLDEVLDDDLTWVEHVDWFFTGGIRAHAPPRSVPPEDDGTPPITPNVPPSP